MVSLANLILFASMLNVRISALKLSSSRTYLCKYRRHTISSYSSQSSWSWWFLEIIFTQPTISRPQRVLHSTLSARLIRNVKKAASSDPNFHYASVSRGLGSLEFDVNAAPSSSLEFADCWGSMTWLVCHFFLSMICGLIPPLHWHADSKLVETSISLLSLRDVQGSSSQRCR